MSRKRSSPSSDDTLSIFRKKGPICELNMSQEEVAKRLQISRQAVHKIERRIVKKLRLAFLDELADENPELCLKVIAEWDRTHKHQKDEPDPNRP